MKVSIDSNETIKSNVGLTIAEVDKFISVRSRKKYLVLSLKLEEPFIDIHSCRGARCTFVDWCNYNHVEKFIRNPAIPRPSGGCWTVSETDIAHCFEVAPDGGRMVTLLIQIE